MKATIQRMRCCVLTDRTRHDVATVRQDDLGAVLDVLAALVTADEAQSAVIARLTQPVPATVEPRLCTRHDCEVSR